MSEQKNTIVVTGCGGAGINIVDKVFSLTQDLGDGFSIIKKKYVDTSESNISKIEYDPKDFWKVAAKGHSKEAIDGSGGIRATNLPDIKESIKDFLDSESIDKLVTGEFHIVVFSASGGSGSILGPLLLGSLMEKDIPVIPIVIGDSSCMQYAENTHKTLASMNSIAKKKNKPLSIIYANNEAYHEGDMAKAEYEANQNIYNTSAAISMFLSGQHEYLDTRDMINMIDQSNYNVSGKDPKVPAGIYGLSVHSGDVELPNGAIPIGIRTLTSSKEKPDVSIKPFHKKHGLIKAEEALSVFGSKLPIHIVTSANWLANEDKNLREKIDDYKNIMNSVQVKDVENYDDYDDDDDGMIV